MNGANKADLAPINILIFPCFIALKTSCFSPSESLLWKTPTIFPNLFFNLDIVCGVKDISGTKNILSKPCFKA